jgi:glycosyltransferase involved in cell wall biosynthesis
MTPLRFLMVLHMPWERNFGGARVQIEMADELIRRGHHVEVFDSRAAFPGESRSRLARHLRPSFSVKAGRFVQANAHRFDVIDAHQGNLPFTKAQLGFGGLLVTRSVGLYSFYSDFARAAAALWPVRRTWRSRLGTWLEARLERRETGLMVPSFVAADVISVPNHDEFAFIRDRLGLGAKCHVLPYGLTDSRREEFARQSRPAAERMASQRVAFVGAWGPRKGARDWGAIVRQVKAAVPRAQFAFMTGCDSATVHRDLGLPECDWIRVTPRFGCDELPMLLADSMVGAFPSYIEGFGLAVLEKLAAGLPTVAYDVPGPRELLQEASLGALTPRGEIDTFARAVVAVLQAGPADYAARSGHCRVAASRFRWPEIVDRALEIYAQARGHGTLSASR